MNCRLWGLLGASMVLTACMDGAASLRLAGNDQTLTLQARQPYFWNRSVEVAVVMSRQPDCLRRSRLDGSTVDGLNVEVFRPDAGDFEEPILILRQGAVFYAVSTRSCELQKFRTAPAKSGTRLGVFRRKGEQGIEFVTAAPPVSVPTRSRQP